MKNVTFAGATLILVGASCIILGGLARAQARETAAVHSLSTSVSQSERLAALPALGATVLLGGVVVTVIGVKRV